MTTCSDCIKGIRHEGEAEGGRARTFGPPPVSTVQCHREIRDDRGSQLLRRHTLDGLCQGIGHLVPIRRIWTAAQEQPGKCHSLPVLSRTQG